MKELLVSLDLELNQPSRRIIQIGAVIGNIRTGEFVSRFASKVSPDEELSPAIAKLAKIKQQEVASDGCSVVAGSTQRLCLSPGVWLMDANCKAGWADR